MRRVGMLQRDGALSRLTRPSVRITLGSVLGALGFCALVAVTATVGVQLAYSERVPAGVQVLDVDVGGRTRTEARGLLQASASSSLRQPVSLHAEGKSWGSTPRDLGMSIDTDILLGQAYAIGREGNLAQRVADQWSALFKGQRLQETGVDFDRDQEEATLNEIAAEMDHPARDASIQIDQSTGVVAIIPEQGGVQLDVGKSADLIEQSLTLPNLSSSIDLVVETSSPSITAADLEAARAKAARALAQPIVLMLDDRQWTIAPPDLARMISFESAPGRPAQVMVNPEVLSDLLGKIAKDVEQPALDARFDWNGGNLTVVRESQEGRGLDAPAVKAHVVDRLFSDDRSIPLALTSVQPAVSSSDGPSLGIKELIQEGRTTFAGSIPEKQDNIRLAASRLNGTVVPPGATFSFNKEVGPTTLAAGFKTGWGITLSSSGAQTIPSVAGGICQVATTLFHPVLHAGYAIEERHSHLYWIPSYGQPPLGMKGLDATVDEDYGLDFQFVNTTADPLLIQSRVDGTTLIFQLYGTKPPWEVKIDGPLITRVVPTDRTPISQAEPTMPTGKSLQVEGAQDGFDVTVTRTVTQGDDVRTLPLKSHYVPSHNVVLYGTGTP